MAIRLGLDQSTDIKKIRAAFDEGRAKFPHYYPLHTQMLRALMPRWDGSSEDIRYFIADIYHATPEPEREEVYARLYWTYATMEGDDYDVSANTYADWVVLAKGFRNLMKRYPESDYWLNAYANMACRVDSDSDYIKLRPDLDKRLSTVVWTDKLSVATCDKKFDGPIKRYREAHPDWQGPAL
jgi:hypothetical protein